MSDTIVAEGFVKLDGKLRGDIRKARKVEITTYLEPLINECMNTARLYGGYWIVKDLHRVEAARDFWCVTLVKIGIG